MKGLEYVISEELRNKAGAATFVLTMFLMAIALIFFLRTQGGEIVPYTNTIGIQVISNTLIPEKHEKRAEKIDSSRSMMPSERRMPENENNGKQIKYKKEREGMGKLLLLYSIFR